MRFFLVLMVLIIIITLMVLGLSFFAVIRANKNRRQAISYYEDEDGQYVKTLSQQEESDAYQRIQQGKAEARRLAKAETERVGLAQAAIVTAVMMDDAEKDEDSDEYPYEDSDADNLADNWNTSVDDAGRKSRFDFDDSKITDSNDASSSSSSASGGPD